MSKKLDVSKLKGYPYTDGGKLDVIGVDPAAADMDDFISGNVREVTSDLEIIPDFAFSGKTGLRTLDLPNATYIGKYAASTPNLSASGSGSSSESEGGYTFNNDNLTTVNMPKVVHICEGAFANDPNLVITELPDSVLAIDKNAFAGSPNVQLRSFPSNVVKIMDNALPTQTDIDLDTVPESLTYLGREVLDRNNVQNYMDEHITFDNQVLDCSQVPAAWFDVFENYGPIFGSQYIANEEEIVFPEGVTSIGENAFWGCKSLNELTIPNSVTSIEGYAFSGCNALTSLTIHDSVTSIGENAFWNCNSLTDIYYSGTEEEWNAITNINIAGFKGTETIHYNS
jgi:hypothetical protein